MLQEIHIFIPMEGIIPILIAIVVFAFQAYANFQKEKEKARKRNLGQPPVPPLPEENAEWVEARPDIPLKPQARQPSHTSQSPIPERFERYSGVMDRGEVRHPRKNPKQLASLRVEVDESDEDNLTTKSGKAFDLRDAVIKSVILERPYP